MPKLSFLYSLAFACALFSGCGLELGFPEQLAKSKATQEEEGKAKLKIFVSNTETDGLIGAGGILQADSLCEQDTSKPNTGVYKALLADGAGRVGEPGKQVGWVLAASRSYVRPDGTLIGITNAQAIFVLPLLAPISLAQTPVWTGISLPGWASGTHCTAWASNSGAVMGMFGYANRVSNEFLLGATGSCEIKRHVYCVEQPEFDDVP